MKASGAEGRGRGGRGGGEQFFPSEGNFSPVVPLSEGDAEEQDETTLVPARVARRPAHEPHARRGFEQSWAFLAAAVVLSAVAGAAAGIYVLKWQSPAETVRTNQPAEAEATEPAAAAPAPQPSEPAPQPERDTLADKSVPPAPPEVTASPREAETKVERVNTSARPPNASRQAAEDEPRAERTTRAPRQESTAAAAPKPQRAEAAPRRAERNTPATVNPPERPSLVTSPPPSANPKKVIKWP